MNFLNGKKFNKFRKSRNNNVKVLGNYYCKYSIISLENSNINSKQIESARKVLVRNIRNNGKIVIRIFPDVPITKKPMEVRMGSGKGDVIGLVYKVKKGTNIIDFDVYDNKNFMKIFRIVSNKIPFKTFLIKNF
ncbi:50S ribosomal protein L16 [Candidatus Vidania fulgoroideorum]